MHRAQRLRLLPRDFALLDRNIVRAQRWRLPRVVVDDFGLRDRVCSSVFGPNVRQRRLRRILRNMRRGTELQRDGAMRGCAGPVRDFEHLRSMHCACKLRLLPLVGAMLDGDYGGAVERYVFDVVLA